jgi:hypothetical protein
MTAVKPEVVSNLEINSVAEKYRIISPILLDNYFAWIIAEHVTYIKGNNCHEEVKFKMADWKPAVALTLLV